MWMSVGPCGCSIPLDARSDLELLISRTYANSCKQRFRWYKGQSTFSAGSLSPFSGPTMTPFGFDSASPPPATSVVVINKEGGEAGIVEDDDDDVIDTIAEKRLLRQLDLRILPFFVFMSIFASLASESLGNVIILNADSGDSLLQALHMTRHQFLVVISTSLVAHALCNSNYIMVLILRFVLGALDMGFLPGVVYITTIWYRLQERSFRISLLTASSPLGAAFSGCIAYGVGSLNGVRGLEGWRWLFLLVGVPPCLLAILIYLILPAYPENATWLSDDGRALAIRRMKLESSKSLTNEKITWEGAKSTLKDWRLYLHYLLGISCFIPVASIWTFTPTIVSGLGYQGRDAQLFAVPPFAAALVATVGLSAAADKYRAWSLCTLVSSVLSGTMFIVQGALPPAAFKARYVSLCFASMFTFMPYPSTMAWLTGNLRNTNAMTLAIPLNMVFSLAGSLTGFRIYFPREAPGYPTGHYTNGAVLLAGAVCVQLLRLIYQRRNRYLDIGQKPWIV
ncbi:MFS general substrate transporter [Desarmillaria tabescens]|uniref:MFS general substrate transporter n=1 Tax=Armillaria tabescens TaxID=1929756 RepID=A0AA39MQ81_ARMTA|nr:MFS general substrate transporter [Desarmillaria tabescens]KAK0442039.1 MFS general substrate transporter [Desarmillaria tabescens]